MEGVVSVRPTLNFFRPPPLPTVTLLCEFILTNFSMHPGELVLVWSTMCARFTYALVHNSTYLAQQRQFFLTHYNHNCSRICTLHPIRRDFFFCSGIRKMYSTKRIISTVSQEATEHKAKQNEIHGH